MFIRKRLLLQADTGATGGEGQEGNSNQTEGAGAGEGQQTTKTFTQAEVDDLIKNRLARANKDKPSKEELEAYNLWKETQKTEQEKQAELIAKAKEAQTEAEKKYLDLEAKYSAMGLGVKTDSINDVITLAKAKVSDDVTLTQAIEKVIEAYPHFKKDANVKTGATPLNPESNSNSAGITKEQFKKMSYSERVNLYNKDKDLYNQLAK